MTSKDQVRLAYRGGADLTFRNPEGKRVKVMHGEEFSVDADTAAILLRDPKVVAVEAEEAAAAMAAGYPGMTVKELHAMADKRGIEMPSRAKKDDLVAALEAADQAPSDEPGPAEAAAAAAKEAGESSAPVEDEGPGTGAITLGDIPDSAKVKG